MGHSLQLSACYIHGPSQRPLRPALLKSYDGEGPCGSPRSRFLSRVTVVRTLRGCEVRRKWLGFPLPAPKVISG